MIYFSRAGVLCVLASVLSFACTATTALTSPTATENDAGAAGEGTTSSDARGEAGMASTNADASVSPKIQEKIGTRIDKGYKTVDVDLSNHGSYTCDETCRAAGGSCNATTGYSAGEVSRKYTNGSGTTDNRIASCSLSESYESFNTTMVSMVCYCDGMTVPPTVRVAKDDGLFTCSTVCRSWSLACSEVRKSKRFGNAQETVSAALSCDASVEPGTHHYACACDPLR